MRHLRRQGFGRRSAHHDQSGQERPTGPCHLQRALRLGQEYHFDRLYRYGLRPRAYRQPVHERLVGRHDGHFPLQENGGLQKLYERRNDRTPHPDRPWVEVGNDGKYYYYGNFDWYGYFYNRVRSQQEHNLSLSGSTDKVSYYASGRFYQQYGMFNINKDKFNDYAFRTKVSARIAPWLKYSNNTSFDTTDYKYGGHQDYEGTINALQSNICAAFLPYNPDGTIVQYVNQLGKNSPIGAGRGGQMTADRSKNTREKRYLTFSNQFDVTLFKKLVLTAVYDYRQRDNLFKYRNNTFEYSRQQGVVETFTSGSVENSYREIHQTYKGHNVNIYGTYENSWGGHNLKITAGGQYEDYRSTSLDAKQTDLSSDDIDSFTVATGPITLSQSITAYRTLGFFGRVNYDYKGRYIFEARTGKSLLCQRHGSALVGSDVGNRNHLRRRTRRRPSEQSSQFHRRLLYPRYEGHAHHFAHAAQRLRRQYSESQLRRPAHKGLGDIAELARRIPTGGETLLVPRIGFRG